MVFATAPLTETYGRREIEEPLDHQDTTEARTGPVEAHQWQDVSRVRADGAQ